MAIAEKLLAEGYTVVAFYNKNEKNAEFLREAGAETVQLDFSKRQDIQAAVNRLIRKYPVVDVLINNHGISQTGLFTDFSDENITSLMDINLMSTMFFTKALIPSMVFEHRGKIINISSVWGVLGASCEVQYSASKAGLIGFTKALAKELGPSNINVNAIAPGFIETEMNKELSAEEKQAFVESTALLRVGKPYEVAELVGFLASKSSDYITGQVISIDGGII